MSRRHFIDPQDHDGDSDPWGLSLRPDPEDLDDFEEPESLPNLGCGYCGTPDCNCPDPPDEDSQEGEFPVFFFHNQDPEPKVIHDPDHIPF